MSGAAAFHSSALMRFVWRRALPTFIILFRRELDSLPSRNWPPKMMGLGKMLAKNNDSRRVRLATFFLK